MAGLVVVLFVLSGCTALIGQVVWMRMLGLVLGNTVWAASTVVAVWMGGMALGAFLGGRLAPRTRRHLRWYAAAEFGVAVFYGLSPQILDLLLGVGRHLAPDLGGRLVVGVLERVALAAVPLAVPTVLMGLTLPVVVERLRGSALAGRVGLLYGANTLGAAGGALLTAYVLLPRLGEAASLAAAAIGGALIAVVAMVLEERIPAPAAPAPRPPAERPPLAYATLVAAMGFSALAAELVWVRILVLHLGSRVYAFAVLLGVYLLGLALGSLAVRALAPRIERPARVLAAVQLAVAAALALQVPALGATGDLLVAASQVLQARMTFAGLQGSMLLTVAILFGPVTMLFGASFPLAVAARPGTAGAGEHTGAVAAANTVGAILGALAGPFLLVPLVGSQRTLLILAALHVVVALALATRRRLVLAAAAATATALVLEGLLLPPDWVLRRSVADDRSRMVLLEESLTATVMVKRYEDARGEWFSLELNRVNVAGTSPELLAVQQLQGHLPLLQAAERGSVLHVGFGSGATAWAVARHPVERLAVVEIAPEVLSASHRFFEYLNHRVLEDGRVRVILNDGRNYLLATDRTYDAILSDSVHPVYAGNSTLYTREYFQLCRERLAPGGVVSMWLPLYSLDQGSYLAILAAFHEVFPRTAVWYDLSVPNEFTVVTGQVEPGPLELQWQRMAEPDVASALAIAGVRSPSDLAADLLLGPREVAMLVSEVDPHVDDRPTVEYLSGRILDRKGSWLSNLLLLTAFRARAMPFAEAPVDWPAVVERRDAALRRHLRAIKARVEGRSQPAPASS